MNTGSDKTFQVTDVDINNLYITGQRACLEKIRRLGIILIPPSDETQGWLAHANDEVLFSGCTVDEVIHRMNAMVYESPMPPSDSPAPPSTIDKKEFPPYTFTKIDEVNNVWGVRAMETPGQESQEGKTVDVAKRGKYGNVLVSTKLGKRVSEYKHYGNRGYMIYEQSE